MNDLAERIDRSGTMLGSSRADQIAAAVGVQGDALLKEVARRTCVTMGRASVDGLILIGGDTTCRAALAISDAMAHRFPISVIPASIDNDVAGTPVTVGFDSAVNTAVASIDRIRQTAMALHRTFLIEVMGHDNGLLAATVAVAVGAEEVLVPEYGPYDDFAIAQIGGRLSTRGTRSNLVIVAEGSRLRERHVKDRPVSYALEAALKAHLSPGTQLRTTILGHIQRGAEPTAFTRMVAAKAGALAAETTVRKALSRTATRAVLPRLMSIAHDGRVHAAAIPRRTKRSVSTEVSDLLALQRILAY